MSFHLEKKHVIDRIFPFAVFFVFLISSLCVVMFAVEIYQSTTDRAESNYESRTALSYITEKIHQGNEAGGVSIGSFDGNDSIIIRQQYEEKCYVTYIYEADGELRELFLQEGVPASAEDGRKIMEADGLKMEEIETGLFRFSCILEDGKESNIVVSTLSE